MSHQEAAAQAVRSGEDRITVENLESRVARIESDLAAIYLGAILFHDEQTAQRHVDLFAILWEAETARMLVRVARLEGGTISRDKAEYIAGRQRDLNGHAAIDEAHRRGLLPSTVDGLKGWQPL